MSEFKREERFIVIKRKNLRSIDERELHTWLQQNEIPTCECVVVESDWPEYEQVRKMIQNRVEGKAASPAEDGREVEVVAYLPTEAEWGLNDRRGGPAIWYGTPPAGNKLMTVAQHERIVATKDAEIARLCKLAYIGEHQFEDCTYKFRLEELRAQPARQVGGGEPFGYWIVQRDCGYFVQDLRFRSCIDVDKGAEYFPLYRSIIPTDLLDRISAYLVRKGSEGFKLHEELRALLGKEGK